MYYNNISKKIVLKSPKASKIFLWFYHLWEKCIILKKMNGEGITINYKKCSKKQTVVLSFMNALYTRNTREENQKTTLLEAAVL